MDKTKTNQKQRPTTLGMDQFLSPFTIKMGSCMHRSSSCCREIILAVLTRFSGRCRCRQVAVCGGST